MGHLSPSTPGRAASAPMVLDSGLDSGSCVHDAPRQPAPAQRRQLILPLAPPLEQRRLRLYLIMILFDGLALALSFAAIGYIYLGDALAPMTMRQAALLVPLYWTASLSLRTYSSPALVNLHFSQARAVLALLAALTVTLGVLFFVKASGNFSRVTLAMGAVLSMVALCGVRSWLKDFVVSFVGVRAENVLVLDDGGQSVRVPHAYHIDCREHHLAPDLGDPHMLDRIGLFMTNMDRVLVGCPPDRRGDWALVFKGANVQGEIVDPEVFALGVLGARRAHSFGALLVSTGPLGLRARATKRVLDLFIASAAVLVLSPLLLVVALFVKLEDGGPVFFVQQRTGRNNRFFPIFKFRSMRVEKLDAHGNRSASKDDDRITRIGRFIRRTSIDELPQLFNVLRGEMSIVGPRPHAIGSRAGDKKFWEIDRRYWLRHSLKPGLTGLAQIRGFRGATDTETDLSDRLQADLEYLDGWTVLRDLRIIFATAAVVVHDRAF